MRAEPAIPTEEVMVPMRDGARLATDVYLPASSARVPAVLVRLPYDKSNACGFWALLAGALTDRGYAVVVQDVRGKARSGGEPLAFVHEQADGYDTLEWLADQPWSNRSVGMFGESYYGFTQWAAAAAEHPALRAIAPRLTTADLAGDWLRQGGVFRLQPMADWAARNWVDGGFQEVTLDWRVRPLRDLLPRRSASFDSWTRSFAFSLPAARSEIATLHWGGWWDLFRRGQIRQFSGGRDQHLLMESIDHLGDELGAPAADDFFASPAAAARAVERQLPAVAAFYDRYLAGRPQTIAPVRIHVAHAGWLESDTWPPPGIRERRLYPAGSGLATKPNSPSTTATWVHDAEDLVPSGVPDAWRVLREREDPDVTLRDDVVTFTGDELRKPLDLAGPLRLEAQLESTSPSPQLHAKLLDVAADGAATRIAEGAGGDLGDVAYRMRRGHRLRLELAGSSFPHYLWDPATGENPWDAERAGRSEHRLLRGAVLRLAVLDSARKE